MPCIRAHRVLWGVDNMYSDGGGWVTVSGSDSVLRLSKSYQVKKRKGDISGRGLEEGWGHGRPLV